MTGLKLLSNYPYWYYESNCDPKWGGNWLVQNNANKCVYGWLYSSTIQKVDNGDGTYSWNWISGTQIYYLNNSYCVYYGANWPA